MNTKKKNDFGFFSQSQLTVVLKVGFSQMPTTQVDSIVAGK